MAKKMTDPTEKTRLKILRQKEKFQVWRNTAAATAANATELTGTETRLAALQSTITEVDSILSQQVTFQASKQLTSQRLKTLVNQGDKLTTVLKAMAKQHYGNGSDKLVEFGIKPLRSRTKPTVVPSTTPPVEAEPSAPTPPPRPPASSTFLGACRVHAPFFCLHIPSPSPRDPPMRAHIVMMDAALRSMDTHIVTMDAHIGAMDVSFQPMGAYIVTMDAHIGSMDTHIATMDASFQPMDAHIVTMDTHFLSMDTSVGTMDTHIVAMDVSIAEKCVSIETMDASIPPMDLSIGRKCVSIETMCVSIERKCVSIEAMDASIASMCVSIETI